MSNHSKRNYVESFSRVNVVRMMIALIIVTSAISRDFKLIVFNSNNIIRQYGSSIGISLPLIIGISLLFFKKRPHKKVICKRVNVVISNKRKDIFESPIFHYFIWGLISCVFLFFNNASFRWYVVGAYSYILYLLLFLLIIRNVSYAELSKGIDDGFRMGLIIQTIIGFLYVFGGILIPYVSNYSNSMRNGITRMVGSFTHPGDFSLYISIIYAYFLCKFLFLDEKKCLLYVVIGFVDIYLSGARTMLIVSLILLLSIIIRRYHKRLEVKVFVVLLSITGGYYFYKSDFFQDLFVKHSFFEMLNARVVHWIIGFKIMFSSISNLFFGIGLNNHVDYIDKNYNEYAKLVYSASTILSSEFVRGMPIHNSLLIVGCELGLFGLFLFLRIFLNMIHVSLIIIRSKKYHGLLRMQATFLVAFTIVMLAYCMQGWAAHKSFSWIMIDIISALSFKLAKVYKNGK